MIKTLRITSVLVVLFTGVVLIFLMFFRARAAQAATEPILSSTSVVEQFRKARGQTEKERAGRNNVSPLVKQAEAYAQYLNPPARSEISSSQATQPVAPIRPQIVSPKFSLIGTSFYPTNPELSAALIDEPGKGFHWVKQSSQVGHLVVDKIKDGAVVIRDGTGTYELTVPDRIDRVSIVEGKNGAPSTVRVSGGPNSYSAYMTSVNTPTQPGPAFINRRQPLMSAPQPEPKISEKDQQSMSELIDKLRELQKGLKSDISERSAAPQDQNALMDRLISDFRASRVSTEEADKLSGLGESLKTGEREPNKNSLPKTTTRPRLSPQPARRSN